MKPGWRVLAGAATAVVVWTLGLCAWALVSRESPTFDLGPTVALDAPATPEGAAPGPLPPEESPAASVPADLPAAPASPDVADPAVPTETAPALPLEPEPAPAARSTATPPTSPVVPAAPAATPAPPVPSETLAAGAPPVATAPATVPPLVDGWQQPSRRTAGQPAGTVGGSGWVGSPTQVEGPEPVDGATRDSGWWDDGRVDCDDDTSPSSGRSHGGNDDDHDGWGERR